MPDAGMMTTAVADVVATVSATRSGAAEPPTATEEPCSRAVTSIQQSWTCVTFN